MGNFFLISILQRHSWTHLRAWNLLIIFKIRLRVVRGHPRSPEGAKVWQISDILTFFLKKIFAFFAKNYAITLKTMVSYLFEEKFWVSEKNRKFFWRKFALEFFAHGCTQNRDHSKKAQKLGFLMSTKVEMTIFDHFFNFRKTVFFTKKIEFWRWCHVIF